MVDAEASFWGRLLAQEPPPIDGSDASKEMLARLHPRHSEGLVVNLPGEATEWDAQRLNAIAVIRTAEDAKQLAENHIKAAIGDAEAGVLPDGTRYSWKAQERKGYTVEASVVRALRRSVAKGGR
jgi:predicted phage-related endonuclease